MEWPKIMFGTGASSAKEYDVLSELVREALESGIRGFDTAPSYGTEAILGKILREQMDSLGIRREELVIQTKIDPWQMQDGRIAFHAQDVMKKMKLDYLDSLLIHWPVLEYLDNTWRELERLKEKGLVRHIGICNVRMRHLNRVIQYPVAPEIVQIERHPLRICTEEAVFCKERGINLQSYSPLCKMDERIRTNEVIKAVADRHEVSIGAAVLRWHMDTGAVPIFTSKKAERIREYANLSKFCLTEDERKAVESLNENYKLYLESLICPGF